MSFSILSQSDPVDTYRTVGVLLANTLDDSAYTGVAPGAGDVQLKKATGAEFNHSGTWTHIANGYWEYVFTATEVNTVGKLSMRITKAGLYGDVYEWQVVPWNVNNGSNLGLNHLDAAITSRLATTNYQTLATMLALPDTLGTGWSLRRLLRAILSTTTGKLNGAGTGVETFRDPLTDEIVATSNVDANGNRMSVTINLAP